MRRVRDEESWKQGGLYRWVLPSCFSEAPSLRCCSPCWEQAISPALSGYTHIGHTGLCFSNVQCTSQHKQTDSWDLSSPVFVVTVSLEFNGSKQELKCRPVIRLRNTVIMYFSVSNSVSISHCIYTGMIGKRVLFCLYQLVCPFTVACGVMLSRHQDLSF